MITKWINTSMVPPWPIVRVPNSLIQKATISDRVQVGFYYPLDASFDVCQRYWLTSASRRRPRIGLFILSIPLTTGSNLLVLTERKKIISHSSFEEGRIRGILLIIAFSRPPGKVWEKRLELYDLLSILWEISFFYWPQCHPQHTTHIYLGWICYGQYDVSSFGILYRSVSLLSNVHPFQT